jgi:hypothetical protein
MFRNNITTSILRFSYHKDGGCSVFQSILPAQEIEKWKKVKKATGTTKRRLGNLKRTRIIGRNEARYFEQDESQEKKRLDNLKRTIEIKKKAR